MFHLLFLFFFFFEQAFYVFFYRENHPRRPRGIQSGREKAKGATKVFKYGQKSPWVPTLTELFPKTQADAGSWLGTKNALNYCAQSRRTVSPEFFLWVRTRRLLFRSRIVWLMHQEMHAVRKLSVWYKIPIWFQNIVCPKTKDAFPKIQAWAYNRYSRLHRSRLA